MKRVLISLTLIGLLGVVEATEDIPHDGGSSNARNLKLTIEASGKTLILYEPLVLTYTVSNTTERTIRSRVKMTFEMGNLKLSIQPGDATGQDYFSGPVADGVLRGDVVHEPGQSMSATVSMFHNDMSGTLAFPEIGRYTIRAKMLVGFEEGKPVYLDAEPLVIDVAEPTPMDRQLEESLGTSEDLLGLLERGASRYCANRLGPSCFEELRVVVRNNPSSAYAPHIAYGLASAVEWGGIDVTPREQLAEELLREFPRTWPDHALSPDVSRLLIHIVAKSGRRQEAIELLRSFERTYPSRQSAIKHLRQKLDSAKETASEKR